MFELSFKKRYSIADGDIDAALTLANTEGFDITDTNYEAQIDWGYSNMTLSLTRNKEVSNDGYDDLELPGKKKMIAILQEEMPGKENDWLWDDWGTDLMGSARKYGDVEYKKYSGTYDGIELDIEIWEIDGESDTEYITELSFKADTYDVASYQRNEMIEVLDGLGILLHEDSLKTQKILSSY